MVEIEIIGVRARPPFTCLRPGLGINRSRHGPVINTYEYNLYIKLSQKFSNYGIAVVKQGEQRAQGELMPYVIKAVQEQQTELDQLKEENEELKQRLALLELKLK